MKLLKLAIGLCFICSVWLLIAGGVAEIEASGKFWLGVFFAQLFNFMAGFSEGYEARKEEEE